jgi:hypothetical protein
MDKIQVITDPVSSEGLFSGSQMETSHGVLCPPSGDGRGCLILCGLLYKGTNPNYTGSTLISKLPLKRPHPQYLTLGI